MLRSYVCRSCLQRLQQYGPRPSTTSPARLYSSVTAGESLDDYLLRVGLRKNTPPPPQPDLLRAAVPEAPKPILPPPRPLKPPKPARPPSWLREEWNRTLSRKQQSQTFHKRRWVNLPPGEYKRWPVWQKDCIQLLQFMTTPNREETIKRRRAEERFMSDEAIEGALHDWKTWDDGRKKDAWHPLVLSVLWFHPERAVAVLEHTLDFKAQGYILADAVDFLARWQKGLDEQHHRDHAGSLADFTVAAVARLGGRCRLRQDTVANLVANVDHDRIAAVYRCLREVGAEIGEFTLVAIARRLAQSPPHKQLALEVVRGAVREGKASLQQEHWQSVCTSIICVQPHEVGLLEDFSPAAAFSDLMEDGLSPNIIGWTALIRSLCLGGQLDTALSVCNIARQSSIELDPVAYCTLLNGAKLGLSASTTRRVVEEAAGRNAIDVVVLDELLASVLHFCEEEAQRKLQDGPVDSVPAFGPMLYYYSRMFNLAPLQALLPLDLSYVRRDRGPELPGGWHSAQRLFPALDTAVEHVAAAASGDKLTPTGATLSIMFAAYVKSISAPIKLITLYAYFRQQVINRNPVAVEHVREKGTFIYDAIIKALIERQGMLRPALDIVSDMLKDTLDHSDPDGLREQHTSLHPPPSVYTWSILVSGFVFGSGREGKSAARIVQMMRKHGIEPNHVTWNTLVSGYAGLQDVGQTVEALRGMERSGYKADSYTLKGFSRLVNREKAFLYMEKQNKLFESAESRRSSKLYTPLSRAKSVERIAAEIGLTSAADADAEPRQSNETA
ncbi:Pentatricopeptide repeat-containing protein [Colletotrichum spinosum]|uniref:Pentatricopeptide repeat-containing protein n=1 Tax=Colletotrichum spinosum TaxID=1347390 RepID=A0A4R8PRF3_9PEZI|nr:Pentatricopeptide repeat-containing protein [Colletotrichum spinosum]